MLVTILLPIVKDLSLIAGIITVGLLLAIGFFLPEVGGKITAEGERVKRLAVLSISIWIVCTIGGIFTELANLLGSGLLAAFDPTTLRSFITQIVIGRIYFIQILISFIVLNMILLAKKVGAIYGAITFLLIALLIPVFQSHASNAGNHSIAIGSLFFHLLFISLWVGGVVGLLVISPGARALSIPRFSSLALWSAIIVTVSGILNAWSRLNFLAGWVSVYGVIVALKFILTGILIVIGAKHRKFITEKLQGTKAVFQLIASEGMTMLIILALGGWLSISAPPINPSSLLFESDRSLILTGIATPPPPTFGRVIFSFLPDLTSFGVLSLATSLYLLGVIILKRRGDHWPVGRTVAFFCGIFFADYATSGGLGIYSHFAFSFHMVAHMVLGMIAPIFFVLSAPMTLALRTLPIGRNPQERGIRGAAIAFIHSKYAMHITHPIVALGIFDGSLFLLYMTPLFGTLMKSHNGHLLMDLHFVAAGYLFFHVIIGVDPNPKKIPYLVRIIVLFAAMSIHAFFSIALLSTTTLVDGGYFAQFQRTWATNLLDDQHTGGAIGWAMGEIPILIALVATFIQWNRDDSREAKRIDRAADRAAAMGEDDDLSKYNKMLAALDKRDQE